MLPEEISSQWRPEERAIIKERISNLRDATPDESKREELKVKLLYLELQPAVFLEANREEFLKHLSIPK